MKRLLKGAAVFLCAAFVVTACSKPPVVCPSPEDNPARHYLSGMEMLEKGRLADASEKFERASFCDASFGPAHSGAAIVAALRARDVADPDHRRIDADKARERLKVAWKSSKGPEEKFAWHLASMRLETALKQGDWLDEVRDSYKAAGKLRTTEDRLAYYRTPEAADYFMGAAFLEARRFKEARESFGAVLNARSAGKWHSAADDGWKKTDRIVRAIEGVTLGDAGRKIAVLDIVTREQAAALLVDELGIERLLSGTIPSSPGVEAFTPADVASSPNRGEVATLVRYNLRGLETAWDSATRAYLFRPSEPVKRKELAMALEDVLMRLTGDEKTASAFLGHATSPFPDIEPTAPWYNAAMSVVTRNIMETGISGEFRPEDPVSGADAVMAIRALKYRLNLN